MRVVLKGPLYPRKRTSSAQERFGLKKPTSDVRLAPESRQVPERTCDRPLSGHDPGAAGREHMPLVQGFLKYFAGLELRLIRGGDLNGLARPGVAPLRSLAMRHAEGSKTR